MIVIAGIPSESPVSLVTAAAEARGADFEVFNQREAPFTETSLRLTSGRPEGSLIIRGRQIGLDSVCGIYARLMDMRDLLDACPPLLPWGPASRAKPVHTHLSFLDLLEVMPCRVMNRTSRMGSNGSKPFQIQLIAACGFLVPPTLVTSDPDEVRSFQRHYGRVVFKSISGVRSIVTELREPWSSTLERVRNLPTQFQPYISGLNIRVHVVGRNVFATEALSDSVDYRYSWREGGETSLRPHQLPPGIEDRCRRLSESLGLPLCGVDLKLTPAGDYYCFEANPSPAFSYYQEGTGQPIAEAIVDYLLGS